MRYVPALVLAAAALTAAVAHAEPGTTTPVTRPSVDLETAPPDDDDTVVHAMPPGTTASPSASPSPSPSGFPTIH